MIVDSNSLETWTINKDKNYTILRLVTESNTYINIENYINALKFSIYWKPILNFKNLDF